MQYFTIIKLDGQKGRERLTVDGHETRGHADARVHTALESTSGKPASNLRNYEATVLTRAQALDLYKQLRQALYRR